MDKQEVKHPGGVRPPHITPFHYYSSLSSSSWSFMQSHRIILHFQRVSLVGSSNVPGSGC